MDERKKVRLMRLSLDMPPHKIAYMIAHDVLVAGLWGYMNVFGLQWSVENHALLVEEVQTLLEGPDIEREWSEEEYKNFVCWKPVGVLQE